MLNFVLWICGAFLAGYGAWRGWVNGRAMLVPAVQTPEELRRRAIGRGQPPAPRRSSAQELRHAFWQLALAIGWLMVAMLGVLMVSVAAGAGAGGGA